MLLGKYLLEENWRGTADQLQLSRVSYAPLQCGSRGEFAAKIFPIKHKDILSDIFREMNIVKRIT